VSHEDLCEGYCRYDSNACTVDRCVGGQCDWSNPCDEGQFCNGVETCVAGVCVAGTPPDCDDGNLCTEDACDPQTGGCVNEPVDYDDGDPCTADSCDPRDFFLPV